MHDPLVVAFDIIRPWPQRSSLPASGKGERWRIRLSHTHHDDCAENGCTGNPFPWWRLKSYSRFWTIAGRNYFWSAMVTIWHREPGGHDSGEICKHYRRWQDDDGHWHMKILHGWKWHVWHWKIQVPPLQHLRRRLLTRCAKCGGPDRKSHPVNVSISWGREPERWWKGEIGLYHHECSHDLTPASWPPS